MASRVTLHIGLPKTASTSLQEALASHPNELAAAGVAYPLAPGARSHEREIADVMLGLHSPQEAHGAGYARLVRRADPGSWGRLLPRVIASELDVVISDEVSSNLPPAPTRMLVDAVTAGHTVSARAVMVVRPAGELLSSAYAQLAQDTILPGFEMWIRVRLGSTLRSGFPDWIDGHWVARNWLEARAGLTVVDYHSPTYWSDLLETLGLAAVRDRIIIGKANRSMTALGLAAWQSYLRSGVDPHHLEVKRLRKAARERIPEFIDAGIGGRLALDPEVADLVDAAFPQPAAGEQSLAEIELSAKRPAAIQAMSRLDERLRDPRPLTVSPRFGHEQVVELVAQLRGLAAELEAPPG